MKKFLEEFKQFALKGNVMDMAIGVIIGGAFQSIVTSLIDNIFNPLIGLFFSTDFSNVTINIGNVSIGIGSFISAVLNFIIMAFVVFVMVKALNKLHKEPPKVVTTKICPHCQSEISLKATRCPFCTSELSTEEQK